MRPVRRIRVLQAIHPRHRGEKSLDRIVNPRVFQYISSIGTDQMASGKFMRMLLVLLAYCCSMSLSLAAPGTKRLYNVYLGRSNNQFDSAQTLFTAGHLNMLTSVSGSLAEAQNSIVYSYKHSFNGFAAMLSAEQYSLISRMPGVVSAFPSQTYQLHTTRSWEFLGLSPANGVWPASNFGANVIVGTIDTGVWPEAASFHDDESLGPVPAKWRGECEAGENFPTSICNKKLIGARYFLKGFEAVYGHVNYSGDFKSARDSAGHGTHTTSTLGGSLVRNVSLYGMAAGDARGGAPHARVAAYKVCWVNESCTDSDMLAAFDQAVYDGVDVLSISLAGLSSTYLRDAISVGSFHATEKGIVVAVSAGNDGPDESTVINVAPWMITVAASSIDRRFDTNIHLGNNRTYSGTSINTIRLPRSSYPLVYGGDIPAQNSSSNLSSQCGLGTLDPAKAKGKIVVCEIGLGSTDENVDTAGGVGYIVVTSQLMASVALISFLPFAMVGPSIGTHILAYIKSTRNPTALISPTISVPGLGASVGWFSSRGPNTYTPDIFKPDVTAPGVDILAAWPPVASPSVDLVFDKRSFKYNIGSGTSMAAPHVGGAAALVKAMHPNWSPSAIKSALMTTATVLDIIKSQNQTNLAFGSGQINPTAAIDPGLVYNETVLGYVHFLCAVELNRTLLEVIANEAVVCPKKPPAVSDLNYPSITTTGLSKTVRVARRVTNVGKPMSTYKVRIHHPPGVKVRVEPSTLSFNPLNRTLGYTVVLTPTSRNATSVGWVFGALVWEDGIHRVRSPIAVGPKVLGV